MARRHRVITVPSGLLLFACIALPGYRDCGRNTAMRADPYLAVACTVGLVVAIAALAFANRRGELGIAIAATVLATLTTGLFALGIAAFPHVYAGVTVGAATAVTLVFGTVSWLRELRDRDLGRSLVIGGAVLAVVVVVTAMCSTWVPIPDKEPDLGPLFIVH